MTIPIMQTNKMQDSKIYFHRFLSPTVIGSGGASVLQDIEIVESEKKINKHTIKVTDI
jgi:hypothetical protein